MFIPRLAFYDLREDRSMNSKSPWHDRLQTCLGQVISLRRKRLGLSQQDLAEQSVLDRAFVSSVERGKRNPSFKSVGNIAAGLQMRYSRLVDNCERCTEEGKEEAS
jgi:transcriptional regulator with XRE-family HTH domain